MHPSSDQPAPKQALMPATSHIGWSANLNRKHLSLGELQSAADWRSAACDAALLFMPMMRTWCMKSSVVARNTAFAKGRASIPYRLSAFNSSSIFAAGSGRARWIDTHPGLVDYINSVQIVVPWGQRKAFLQEQRDHETMGQPQRRCRVPAHIAALGCHS